MIVADVPGVLYRFNCCYSSIHVEEDGEEKKKEKEEKKEKIRELVLGGFPMACLFHIAFNVLHI